MKFYWVNANKASDNRWLEVVFYGAVLIPVSLKYLKKRKRNKEQINQVEMLTAVTVEFTKRLD